MTIESGTEKLSAPAEPPAGACASETASTAWAAEAAAASRTSETSAGIKRGPLRLSVDPCGVLISPETSVCVGT